MNILLSLISLISLVNIIETKEKFCINCKHFLPTPSPLILENIVINNDKMKCKTTELLLGRCNVYNCKPTNLVTGENMKMLALYCRSKENLCGREGKNYEEKNDNEEDNKTDNKEDIEEDITPFEI